MNNDLQTLAVDPEAYHGGIDPRELARYGIDINDAIDFSSNILPHGPSPKVIAAIASAAIDRYPDRESDELRSAISEHYGVDRDRLLIGNGCSEVIHLIAGTLLEPGDRAVVLGPTFSEYARASRLALAKVESRPSLREGCFLPYLRGAKGDYEEPLDAKMVWVCNPNNPTAQVIPRDQLISWLEQHRETWFVVDESYIEFSESAESLLPWSHLHPNLIVLRSMTKSFAIPGVRLGFAVLSPEACERLRGRRVPWNVSSLAQAAGVAALSDPAYYEAALRDVRESKRKLVNDLVTAGYEVIPGDANFFLLRTDDARSLREKLLRQGMVVRDCESFGLNDCVRIAARDQASNDRLVDALLDRAPAISSSASGSQIKPSSPTTFDDSFRHQLNDLFRKRRDVRRFRTDPIEQGAIERWVEAACLAPSVGLSQPWRFVSVKSPNARASVVKEFERQNEIAAEGYADAEVAKKYRELKLAGLREAPEHLAVFVEPHPELGRGLGRATMPESVAYSVVAAIQNLWLAARAEGVGVGWVSILRPEQIVKLLNLPSSWQLVAYLCIGWPQVENDEVPELEQVGWERRVAKANVWMER
jgi:L-threonine-O-3-phosphate decarboxylase/5,6-dimethylbenzimidazole synthase